MAGIWYFQAASIANVLHAYACSTSAGATTKRGNSPCPALMAKCRSACAVYVGRPVAGPVRCPSTTTMGSSAWPARLRPSTMRAKPPPEVPTAARSPA